MRAMPFKAASTPTDNPAPMSSIISEALKKQAALRPPKGKPKIMPLTPRLPPVPKPYKKRKPNV